MTHLPDPARALLFDLSTRSKLRVTGADAFRFLNGQISNDLRKATKDSAIQASVLSAKGKLHAMVFVSTEADSFMLDSDPELREALSVRIERYVIADDVQVDDVTERFAIFHLTGQTQPPSVSASTRMVQAIRFGRPGWDIWLESGEHDRVFQELSPVFALCDEECEELLRIEHGIPRWGRELTDQIIPTEANLEATSIDYGKGCYIGQEVISRIKSSGQTNKRLCGLVSLSGAPLQSGMRLVTGEEHKEVGWITSAIRSPGLDQEIALGYLKRGFTEAGLRLQTRSSEDPSTDAGLPIEVVALPFL